MALKDGELNRRAGGASTIKGTETFMNRHLFHVGLSILWIPGAALPRCLQTEVAQGVVWRVFPSLFREKTPTFQPTDAV